MKKLFILTFLLHTFNSNCQKIFLDENKNPLQDSLNAKYFKLNFSDNPEIFKEICFFKTGEKESEIQFSKKTREILKVYNWYVNGNLRSEINYLGNRYNGLLVTYWKNGSIRRKDYFNMGKYETGTCYDSIGNEVKHYDYEIPPEYKGGKDKLMRVISNNLIYPEKLRGSGIQGKVVVRFTIKADGTLADIGILKGVNSEFDNEAIRVISKLKKFKPGLREGEIIPWYNCTLPINFMLN